jgi:hypothetical protein
MGGNGRESRGGWDKVKTGGEILDFSGGRGNELF